MKLSEALQHCIDKGYYQYPNSEFMCITLRDNGLGHYMDSVMDHVKELGGEDCTTLGNAIIDYDAEPEIHGIAIFERCKEHYINWIKELKEQGL